VLVGFLNWRGLRREGQTVWNDGTELSAAIEAASRKQFRRRFKVNWRGRRTGRSEASRWPSLIALDWGAGQATHDGSRVSASGNGARFYRRRNAWQTSTAYLIPRNRKTNSARDLQDRLGILALLALSAPFRICKLQIPLATRETDPVSGHHLESMIYEE
jgi:hypothetical protein